MVICKPTAPHSPFQPLRLQDTSHPAWSTDRFHLCTSRRAHHCVAGAGHCVQLRHVLLAHPGSLQNAQEAERSAERGAGEAEPAEQPARRPAPASPAATAAQQQGVLRCEAHLAAVLPRHQPPQEEPRRDGQRRRYLHSGVRSCVRQRRPEGLNHSHCGCERSTCREDACCQTVII